VADRLAATGVLLVGGASDRFGSPKALARFRGETLAERGLRLLGEVFDEVLVVGKAADGIDVPRPLVDDGASDRAPVFGLIAGLRAATHDLCVVLPVDCPLVTPETLHRLADQRAVPQTGPLPGAYEQGVLPELELRVAAGELSLRGVNPNVIDVDEAELVNANTRAELLVAAVADWAEGNPDVKALLLVGSQARVDMPADRWSDVDLVVLLEDPAPYTADVAWIREFGTPLVTFLEATLDGHWERRVLYDTGEDVDFVLFPVSVLDRLETSENAGALLRRGYRVLVDRIGLEEQLRRFVERATVPATTTQSNLDELASDFWYHVLWTAKKLRRGEVFTAIECLDGYMMARLVALMELHAKAVDPSVDTWRAGRFVERWGDPGALVALEFAFARYSVRDVARGLWETIDLFQGLEEETAKRLGLEAAIDHPELRRRVAEVVPDPRRASTLLP
jgi:molybdopterin-guanine dinucleotide biosynthesis protein A